MKCPACGIEVDHNAVYCQHCGERVDMPDADLPGPADETLPPEPPPLPTESRTVAGRLAEAARSRREAGVDIEEELWQGRYCGKAMMGAWLSCGAATVGLLALGIWFSVNDWIAAAAVRWGIVVVLIVAAWVYPLVLLAYRRLGIRYRLTSQRFFHEKGILRHVTDRIEVIDMDDITFDQTILGRIFNVGTIHITSSDRTDPLLNVEGIADVKRVASLMDDARRKERIQRSIHIESV